MHLMHLIWVFGHIIGFFHQPAMIVVTVMTIAGLGLIFIFYKVFEGDLFNNYRDD